MTPDLVERVARAIADASNNLGSNPLPHLHHTSILVETMARAAIEVVLEEAAKVAEKATPRAHTYASENADIYRAYDKGAWDAIKAIRALKEDE